MEIEFNEISPDFKYIILKADQFLQNSKQDILFSLSIDLDVDFNLLISDFVKAYTEKSLVDLYVLEALGLSTKDYSITYNIDKEKLYVEYKHEVGK